MIEVIERKIELYQQHPLAKMMTKLVKRTKDYNKKLNNIYRFEFLFKPIIIAMLLYD